MQIFRSRRRIAVVAAFAGFLGFFLIAQVARSADLANAKKIYEAKCAKCHGLTGKGDGPKAKILLKKPTNFTNTVEMAKHTDVELKQAILEGRKPMGAYKGKLSDKDIDDLVAYIHAFAK
jgi:mono/diheme cytochrome c family protein